MGPVSLLEATGVLAGLIHYRKSPELLEPVRKSVILVWKGVDSCGSTKIRKAAESG
jgi:hypothetical protein